MESEKRSKPVLFHLELFIRFAIIFSILSQGKGFRLLPLSNQATCAFSTNNILFTKTTDFSEKVGKFADDIKNVLGVDEYNEMQVTMHKNYSPQKNFLLVSPTGSGKTLAYLLPLAQQLRSHHQETQILILVPTRELALQLEDVFKRLKTGVKITCCYGRHSIEVERRSLMNCAPHAVVGTPGRIAAHCRSGLIDGRQVKTIVFDEFDKSLELGFSEDMENIITYLPNLQNRILVSATESIAIPNYVSFTHPQVLRFEAEHSISSKLSIKVLRYDATEKLEALVWLLCSIKSDQPVIVFFNHRDCVTRMSNRLKERKIVHECFHGKMDQWRRELSLTKLRNLSVNILLATDLAARGIDILDIKHIIHYQAPSSEETFIHRNGRTARVDRKGKAYMLLSHEEQWPSYLPESTTAIEYQISDQTEVPKLPKLPKWVTLILDKGKKDKINKVDVLGYLCKKGDLKKDEIGLIEVKDFTSLVAVNRKKMKQVLRLTRGQKIKSKSVRITCSR